MEAERCTGLDRQLLRDARDNGVVDLAPHADRQPDEFTALKVGRLRTLEALGRGLALARSILRTKNARCKRRQRGAQAKSGTRVV